VAAIETGFVMAKALHFVTAFTATTLGVASPACAFDHFEEIDLIGCSGYEHL
jgi:hypothetical protein